MKFVSVALALTVIFIEVNTTTAATSRHTPYRPEPIAIQTVIKTIPEPATLEYRVRGVAMQSMNIEPGVYKITVQKLR